MEKNFDIPSGLVSLCSSLKIRNLSVVDQCVFVGPSWFLNRRPVPKSTQQCYTGSWWHWSMAGQDVWQEWNQIGRAAHPTVILWYDSLILMPVSYSGWPELCGPRRGDYRRAGPRPRPRPRPTVRPRPRDQGAPRPRAHQRQEPPHPPARPPLRVFTWPRHGDTCQPPRVHHLHHAGHGGSRLGLGKNCRGLQDGRASNEPLQSLKLSS